MATARVRWLFVFCLIGLAVYSSNLSLLRPTSRDPTGSKHGGGKGGGGSKSNWGRAKVSDKVGGGEGVSVGGGAAGYQTVFAPDGYEKHLVIPSMAKEDISWVRHLPEDLNIVLKNYVMDAKGKKVRPGALTVPINKVGASSFSPSSSTLLSRSGEN